MAGRSVILLMRGVACGAEVIEGVSMTFIMGESGQGVGGGGCWL